MPQKQAKPEDRDFASVKLPREFVTQLKIEAARRGVPMYEVIVKKFPELKQEGKP